MSEVRHRQCKNKKGYFEAFQKDLARKGSQAQRGLGDTIKRVTDATGITEVAKLFTKITGKSCGCGKRQAKLNQWFAYKQHIVVGVTTAPRKQATLQTSIVSIVENQWEPHIFAEPGSELTGLNALPIHHNSERLGAWRNWVHACETLLKETKSDYILTVQDDVKIVPGTAGFLKNFEWPANDCGMVSLYTPTQYAKNKTGCFPIKTRSLWGACAMLFKRAHLKKLLNTKVAKNWNGAPFKTRKRKREPHEVANIDTAIGKMLAELNLKPYFFTPSLSQHFAEYSSIGHGGLGPKRTAKEVVSDFSVFK